MLPSNLGRGSWRRLEIIQYWTLTYSSLLYFTSCNELCLTTHVDTLAATDDDIVADSLIFDVRVTLFVRVTLLFPNRVVAVCCTK